ncbi:hypothetical protein ECC23_05570 [Helicobacter pylori]|nr:hypothetical protein ECC23_05570 [Helicobacter pylori]
MVSNSLNVLSPQSSFLITHLTISVHFRIEPFQKLLKIFFLLPPIFSKSFFSNLILSFWNNQHYI